jgi:hypothetical protein
MSMNNMRRMKKMTYIKTNKNLTMNEIKVLAKMLSDFFETDLQVVLENDEIIFLER